MRALSLSWLRCVWKESDNALNQGYTRMRTNGARKLLEIGVSVIAVHYTDVHKCTELKHVGNGIVLHSFLLYYAF